MTTPLFVHPVSRRLRDVALALPEASEGTSCVNRAFRVGKKAYFYLGEKPGHIYAMLKLTASYAQAQAMEDPQVSPGKHGWVTLRFQADAHPDPALLARWVVESYRALAPKRLRDAVEVSVEG